MFTLIIIIFCFINGLKICLLYLYCHQLQQALDYNTAPLKNIDVN